MLHIIVLKWQLIYIMTHNNYLNYKLLHCIITVANHNISLTLVKYIFVIIHFAEDLQNMYRNLRIITRFTQDINIPLDFMLVKHTFEYLY